jgi:hypothetical protein
MSLTAPRTAVAFLASVAAVTLAGCAAGAGTGQPSHLHDSGTARADAGPCEDPTWLPDEPALFAPRDGARDPARLDASLGAAITVDKHPCVFIHVTRAAAHWRVQSFAIDVYQSNSDHFRGGADNLDRAFHARHVDPYCSGAEATIVMANGPRRVSYATTIAIGDTDC